MFFELGGGNIKTGEIEVLTPLDFINTIEENNTKVVVKNEVLKIIPKGNSTLRYARHSSASYSRPKNY